MDPYFVFKCIKLYYQQWLYIRLFCCWSRCEARRPTLTSSFYIRIRNSGMQYSDKIQGIQIDNSEVKLALFAGDLTCFLRNRSSYNCLRECLSKFSECSGLKVNEEKTDFFRLDHKEFRVREVPNLKLLSKFLVCILIIIM